MSLTEAQQRLLDQSSPANRKIGLGRIIAYLQSAVASLLEGGGGSGDSAYVYVRYATNDSGMGFSASPSGKTYIAVLSTNTPIENPVANDFNGLWVKFVGDAGAQGNPGAAGTSAYVYVRYAYNSSGDGFTSDPAGMTYMAVKTTNYPLAMPVQSDFNGLWSLIQGNAGAPGAPGPNVTIDGMTGSELYAHFPVVQLSSDDRGFTPAKADTQANCEGLIGRNTMAVTFGGGACTIATSYGHTFTNSSFDGANNKGKTIYLATNGGMTLTRPDQAGNAVFVLGRVVTTTGDCVWTPQFMGVIPS
jgi:hypothetical protein